MFAQFRVGCVAALVTLASVALAIPASAAGKQVTVGVSFHRGTRPVHDEVVVVVPAGLSLASPPAVATSTPMPSRRSSYGPTRSACTGSPSRSTSTRPSS